MGPPSSGGLRPYGVSAGDGSWRAEVLCVTDPQSTVGGADRPRSIPWRAILIGSILLPVNAVWLARVEVGAGGVVRGTTSNGPYPSTLSLFANVICVLVALGALNALLRRIRPRWVLTQSELLIVYIMLSIGTCLTSIDFLDVLFPMLAHPLKYASAANGWQDLFIKHLAPWTYVRDADALKGWYQGGADPYTLQHIRAWLTPVAAWCGLTLAMIGAMFCMNVLLRVQWTRHEKLSYPIIELPMDITHPSGAFYRQPAMWIGFSLAGAISLVNGLAVLMPGVPSIPIKAQDISVFFPSPPWNAMGWTPIAFYPFAIGLGFLLPADMLFSCWFFALWWRVERVGSAYYGLTQFRPNFPYVNEQSFGIYMAVAALALWGARRHLADVATQAWRSGRREPDAPMSYRTALAGTVVGFLLCVVFFHMAGLPLWMCFAAFAIYFAIALACTRMRAELGPPAHDLHNGGPDYILTACLGTRGMSPQTLGALTWFYWFNRAYRSIAMPYQMEAFKIGERRGISIRGIAVALGIATIVGLISGCWALYALPYRLGAETNMAGHFPYFGWEAYNRLASWIQTPRDTDGPAVVAIVVGFISTLALQVGRMRFSWWPFHPLGYAVSGSFSMSTMWVPMLIAWMCKVAALRYGGLATYRRFVPFFLGLMLGDYLFGCAWPMVGWLIGANTYCYYF